MQCFLSQNRTLLTKAFGTYVRPLIEYCCTTWSPHLQYLIDKIERVQRYFTKRLKGLWRVCYTEWLRILGLEQRRRMFDLSLCYQIVYKLVDTSLANVLVFIPNHHTRSRPSLQVMQKNHLQLTGLNSNCESSCERIEQFA